MDAEEQKESKEPKEQKEPTREEPGMLDKVKSNESVSQVIDYAQTHKQKTAAYVLLVLGLVIFIFNVQVGGTIVGFIGGFYFSLPIIAAVKQIKHFVNKEEAFKSFLLGAIALCLVASIPAFFIGLAAAVLIRAFVMPETS